MRVDPAFLFALFSTFLHRAREEPEKAGEGCGKMLESEQELGLLVEHIAVCVEMFTAVTTLDEYALATVL